MRHEKFRRSAGGRKAPGGATAGRSGITRRRVVTGGLVAGTILAALLPAGPGYAAVEFKVRATQRTGSVSGAPVRPEAPSRVTDTDRAHARPAQGTVRWPAAGERVVDLTGGTAGRPRAAAGLPLSVAAPARSGSAKGTLAAAAQAPGKVRLRMADRRTTAKAGVAGVLLGVGRADGQRGAGTVSLRVDYGAFRGAYGADWATRLRLVQLPACALTTPEKPACKVGKPLATRNNVRTGTLTADVPLAPVPRPAAASAPAASAAPAAPAALTAVAATAAPSGGNGDFTATPLAPSGTWAAGGNEGGFGWQYPLPLPPVPGGLAPKLQLGYSSSSIDGRTASSNNQSSWIGDGWSMETGFIERQYMSCPDDNGTGSNAPAASGDLCWHSDNAVMSLNGSSTPLVKDRTTGVWKPAQDDGSRVEHLNGGGTDTANGDDDNEYWKVTTAQGAQYFFGKHRLPGWSTGKAETNSTFTVPVFGNHAGEPGHATAFADSWRNQAWRWNLDYVVDPQGNAMAYFYNKETGAYARNTGGTQSTMPKADAAYVRGGTVDRIEYGHRAGQVYVAQPAAKVVFGTAPRCLGPASDCTFDKAHAANWPDTPVDQSCTLGADCQVSSPAFFSTRRLTTVTAQALKDGAPVDVDTWALTHTFPGTGDSGGAALWLDSIVRTGKAGGTLAMPPVTFGGTLMPNRVDAAEGRPPLNKYRITRVSSESGGETLVDYSATECTYDNPPVPESNSKRCFPTWWTPRGGTEPVKDWFHKYVVTKVTANDLVAGATSSVTSYEYLGGAGWALADDEFTLAKHRTYSQYRGYGRVRTRTGTTNRTQTESAYLRGFAGAGVPDSFGGTVTDAAQYAGMEIESLTYDKDGGAIASAVEQRPWSSDATAVQSRAGTGDLKAFKVGTGSTTHRTLLSSGAWREVRVTNGYDGYGRNTTVSDEGDLAVTGDEHCTRTAYTTPDTTNWLIGYPSSVQRTSAVCDTPADAGNITDETRTTYDNGAFGAAPVAGKSLATKIEDLDRFEGGQPVFVTTGTSAYDAAGRLTKVTDAAGRTTLTEYLPAAGAQATTVRTTDPKGFVTSADTDGLRGLTVQAADANGRTTYQEYDPLGRLTAAWRPGRAKSSPADVLFTYQVRRDAPTTVTSKTLLEGGKYRTAVTLYDGLLRTRQVQTEAQGGGRIVQDTFYDAQGRVSKANGDYFESAAPGTAVLAVADNQIPAQTRTEFDGQGRATASVFYTEGAEKWRSTTTYGGNWTAVVPPQGGTASLTVANAQGKPVEVRQYKNGNPLYTAAPAAYEALKYTYDNKERLTRVVDAAGNEYLSGYDLRGRELTSKDPDKGTVTKTYTVDGKLATSTDARGQVLAYEYDELGRPSVLRKGGPTGAKLAEWTYDTLAGGKGKLTSSTRYDNGSPYTTAVKGYDPAGRATGSTVSIPAAEGALAGSYAFGTEYTPDTGLIASASFPAGGGLPAETVYTQYTPTGLPSAVDNGEQVYSLGNVYSPFGETLQTVLGDVGGRTVQTYTYEKGTRRLATLTNDREASGPQTLDSKSYGYDPAGNITRIRNERNDKSVLDTQCFQYDHARRLNEAWTSTDDCAAKPGGGARPAVGGVDPYWYSYTFDAVGNRTAEVQHDPAGDTAKDVRRGYTYPAAGAARPHAVTSVGITGPGARTDSFEYDATGNTTRRVTAAGDQVLTWDAEGRMESSTTAGRKSTFLYDADGKRLLRRDADAVTLYLGGEELRLTKADGKVTGTRFYVLGKTTAVRSSSGAISYLLPDHQGTDEVAVDASTMAVVRRDHGPFGTARGSRPGPGQWAGEHGFVGGTNDAATGLTHLGAREYDAANGRFVSVDPVVDRTNGQQLGGYAYAGNSPVTDSDPSGAFSIGQLLNPIKALIDTAKEIVRTVVAVAKAREEQHQLSYQKAWAQMWRKGEKGSSETSFNVGKGEDRGIIMMRFFIHTEKAMDPVPGVTLPQLLGDNRDFSTDPDAPYRMVLFWNTETGDVTFSVSPSHTNPADHTVGGRWGVKKRTIPGKSEMLPANPIKENGYEGDTLGGNNIVSWQDSWHRSTSPEKLDLGVYGVQPLISVGAVDNDVTIAANSSSVTVTRKGDPYPDMEVVQYKRGEFPKVIAQDRMASENGLDSLPFWPGKIDRAWTDGARTKG